MADRFPYITSVLLILFFFGIWATGCKRNDPLPPTAEKRNVLLIVVDTLRADHLGLYGYPRNTSPHMDALGREGVWFAWAHSVWPTTSPSIAALLTGTYGEQNGVMRTSRGQALPKGNMTVAEILQEHGIRTVAISSNPNLSKAAYFDQGFDEFFEVWCNVDVDGLARCNDAGRVNEVVLPWIKRHAHDQQPFFLYLHYMDPHDPYDPPKGYKDLFVDDEWYRQAPMAVVNTNHSDIGGFPKRFALNKLSPLDTYIALYDAEIRYADDAIGKVLALLHKTGLDRTTMVIITADHGEGFGEHKVFSHGRVGYEETMHVPLIVRIPDAKYPRRVDTPVSLLDIAPTICGWFKLTFPERFQGVNLNSVVQSDAGEDSLKNRYFMAQAGYGNQYQQIVYHSSRKYILMRSEGLRRRLGVDMHQLYDLHQNPGETRNIFASSPEVAQSMQRALLSILEQGKSLPTIRPAKSSEIDPSVLQQLESLGYVK